MSSQTLTTILTTIELALTQLSQGLARRVDITLDDGIIIKVYRVGTLLRIDISEYST